MEFYHVLNRGADKRKIFLDDKDRFRFIHDLFEFNDTNNVNPNNGYFFRARECMDVGRPYMNKKANKHLVRATRDRLVKIHAFCLMPNHYHLLLSPIKPQGISLFLKKLNGGYSKYFNERHGRGGTLYQGKYKKILIENDAHFLYIPFYIHFNPLDLRYPDWRQGRISNHKDAEAYLLSYRWSSHPDYLGERNFPSVTDRSFLSSFFKENHTGYRHTFTEMVREFDCTAVDSSIFLE